MKKVIFSIAVVALIAMSGCSFVKDVQAHCKVNQKAAPTVDGSFEYCLKCDSLANVVRVQIAKAQAKIPN